MNESKEQEKELVLVKEKALEEFSGSDEDIETGCDGAVG